MKTRLSLLVRTRRAFLVGGSVFAALAGHAHASSTICQAGAGGSYCSDQTPGPVDGLGYRNLVWVNLNKNLASIAVNDNQVWGLDSARILWYLPNFKTGTTWTKVASGVVQISAAHDLLCQINLNQHVYCVTAANPLLSTPDFNGFQSLNWFDTGASNFRQIAASAGTQFWGVDTSGQLIQVQDYRNVAGTSTKVAAGVQQVAVDGRGLVCQINIDKTLYCSNWAAPDSPLSTATYHGLPWFGTNAQFNNITVADGQVFGVDPAGKEWQLPDYANRSTWFPIANGGVGAQMSGASSPSTFVPTAFSGDEVAVLLFMGQSNAVGVNVMPSRFIAPTSSSVWGVTNMGWNFLAGNTNGTTEFTGAIASITDVAWSRWSILANGPDMNLGFNNGPGAGGNAANFAAFQWQQLVNAGWKLPDLYIVHIGWPSQGVAVEDVEFGSAPWIAHGVNLWQPNLAASQLPSYALAPFARTIVYRGLQKILASGKKPRVLGLQWNQWEAEAGSSNPASVTNAPANYRDLVNKFNTALGFRLPIQFAKPLAPYPALAQMQTVFANLVATDPANLSLMDVSRVSSQIFSGGLLGGGDNGVHYNLDSHQWFAQQAIAPCIVNARCGTRVTTLPSAAPN